MNLRDLIYTNTSQSMPSEPLPAPLPLPVPPRPSQEEKEQLVNAASEVECVSDTRKRKTQAGAPANGRTQSRFVLPVYSDAPKVKQRLIASEGRRDGVRIPLSAPGLVSPLKYPTSSGAADCSNKLTALRDIWQRCYFAKDFEGSAMALGVLAEVAPVEPHDIISAAKLLSHSDSRDASVKKLVQGILKPFVRSGEKKTSAVQLGTELLTSVGDVASAHKLLQENLPDLAFQGRSDLLCYDTLVLVASATQLAAEIDRITGNRLGIPTVEDIVRDPFEFTRCVRLLNTIRISPTLSNARIKAKKHECKLLLQDLKASFAVSVTANAVVHERMTMEALYVAYLAGLEHTSRASRYIAGLRKLLPVFKESTSNDSSALQAAYYRLLSAYLVRYRYALPAPPVTIGVRSAVAVQAPTGTSDTSMVSSGADYSAAVSDAGYQRVLQALLREADHRTAHASTATPTLQTMYHLHVLHITGVLERPMYLGRLCDLIECLGAFGTRGLSVHTAKEAAPAEIDVLQYYLWMELCNVLGPLAHQVGEEDELLAGSEALRFLAGHSGAEADEANLEPDEADAPLHNRRWWIRSILSASQLDGFGQSSPLPVDPAAIDELLNTMQDGDFQTDWQPTSWSQWAAPDTYSRWLQREKSFADALDSVFASARRKMSAEGDSEGEGSDEDAAPGGQKDAEDMDTGAVGDGLPPEASQMSNVSNDDAEYHSQESEAEVLQSQQQPVPAAGADAASSSGSSASAGTEVSAARFVKEVLSVAVENSITSDAVGTVTLKSALLASEFQVRKDVKHVKGGGGRGAKAYSVVSFVLGVRLLEILACQAIVRAHLDTQDNMFTVRAVQIIVAHAQAEQGGDATANVNSTAVAAKRCLAKLLQCDVRIRRALKIGACMVRVGVNVFQPPREDVVLAVTSAPTAGGYIPV